MTDLQPSDELIARVLAGEATAEESAAVARWVDDSPEHRATLERLGWIWRDRPAGPTWDVDRAWARVAAQVERADHEVEVIPIPRAPSWTTTAWRIAAALLLVVGVVFAWRAIRGGAVEFATGPGELRELALDDGTAILLAPNSRLRIPRDFPASRQLVLEGEGSFAVGTESEAPFAVEVGRYMVRDIGTEFTVRSHSTDSLNVAVVDGVVLVTTAAGTSDTLRGGDVAAFGGGAVTRRGDPALLADALSWRGGSLAFTATPASVVLGRLAEWHGVTVRLDDATLGDRPVTVTLPTDSLDEALDVVALLLGVEVERRGESIVLR